MELGVHPIDILCAVLLLVAGFCGFRRGLSGELARIATAVIAAVAAWALFPQAVRLLTEHTRVADERQLAALAVTLVFLLAYLLVWALRLVLRHMAEFKFKGRLERVGGVLSAMVRWAVVLCILIVAVDLWSDGYLREQVVEQSVFGRTVSRCVTPLYDRIAEEHPVLPPRRPAYGDEESPDDQPVPSTEEPYAHGEP